MEIVVFLFNRDLRIEDNHGLYRALTSGYLVYPLFILNHKQKLSSIQKNAFFYFADLLKKKLESLGSSLDIKEGDPLKIFLHLIRKFKIKAVYSNNEYDPSYIKETDLLKELLLFHKIEFYSYKDNVVFEKNELLDIKNKPFDRIDLFSKKWKEKVLFEKVKTYPSEKKISNFIKIFPFENQNKINIVYNNDKKSVCLRYGTKSVRYFVNNSFDYENNSILEKMILRDYFFYIAYHYPDSVSFPFKEKYKKIDWNVDKEILELWKNGNTGFPLIDASIRELRSINYISHEKRLLISYFLTKNLLFSWKEGLLFFSEFLIDYDPIITSFFFQRIVGCWVDSFPYFKLINPNLEIKNIDPKMILIKKWVPEFKNVSYLPIVDFDKSKVMFLNRFKNIITKK